MNFFLQLFRLSEIIKSFSFPQKMYLKKNFLSEEPSDWLEQVSSAPLSRLQRLVQLLGGQGVALGNI